MDTITVADYVDNSETSRELVLPEKIDKISFSYDGGRVSVCINGVSVYEDNGISSDFEIELQRNVE